MKFITKQALRDWLDSLAKEVTLIAPVETDMGVMPGMTEAPSSGLNALYKPVASADEIMWDFKRTLMSIREFVWPKTETLFTIETDEEGKTVLNEVQMEGSQVIFGVRPCDGHGLRVLDAIMMEDEPVDTCYADLRAKTTLVGLACPEMWDGCFCTSIGGAPNGTQGLDMLLTEVAGKGVPEDGYAVQVITEKGEKLAQGMGLQEVDDLELPEPELKEPFELPTQEQLLASFSDEYWERLGDRCISCRVCGFVCPTCRCFDVRDETITTPEGTHIKRRVRSWDSCQGQRYRVVAGGANPRAQVGQRACNRFFCKSYYVPTDYDVPFACVGCGRCIVACPVNIDISEALRDVAQRETA